jgi:hypothetical protein
MAFVVFLVIKAVSPPNRPGFWDDLNLAAGVTFLGILAAWLVLWLGGIFRRRL